MALPTTYYDFVKNKHAYIAEYAELDANDLMNTPNNPLVIRSVEDYRSRFDECMNHLAMETLGSVAQKHGLSIDEVRSIPELQADIASLFTTANYEYHSLVNCYLAGKKTFHFSDNLSDHLSNTEINLDSSLINLPFPTCLFTFTSRSVIDAMHNSNGNEGRRKMNRVNGLNYSAPISVFASIYEAGDGLPGRKLMIVAFHARTKLHFMLKRELYLGEGWTLEKSLRTDWNEISPDHAGGGMSISRNEGIELHGDETFYTDGLMFYRIILNAILYLSSDQAERTSKISEKHKLINEAKSIVSASKRRKKMQSAARYSELDYDEVGTSIGTIVVKQKNTESNRKVHSTINSPKVRFMVRGHWRRQLFGPGHEQEKLIWIRPYYKGPPY